MQKYTEKEIKRKLEISVGMLFKNDAFLVENVVNERSISHKLAEYLQLLFPDYNVDCEYNRMEIGEDDEHFMTKRLNLGPEPINSDDTEAKTVFPDIIVHKRGNNDDNLLVIEIKKADRDTMIDEKKLKAFTNKCQLKYALGCLLTFSKSGHIAAWYKDGKKLSA